MTGFELNRYFDRSWRQALAPLNAFTSPLNAVCNKIGHRFQERNGWMYCTNTGCSYRYRSDGGGKPVGKGGGKK